MWDFIFDRYMAVFGFCCFKIQRSQKVIAETKLNYQKQTKENVRLGGKSNSQPPVY